LGETSPSEGAHSMNPGEIGTAKIEIKFSGVGSN